MNQVPTSDHHATRLVVVAAKATQKCGRHRTSYSVFQTGVPPPRSAEMKGAEMLLLREPKIPTSPLLLKALSQKGRIKHARMLKLVRGHILVHPDLRELPIGVACSTAIAELAVELGWGPSTVKGSAAALQAGLLRAVQYQALDTPIDLRASIDWTDAMRAWSTMANATKLVDQQLISKIEFESVLRKEADPTVRVALILNWAAAARPSNTIRLEASDVRWKNESGDMQRVDILWRFAKNAHTRGPYTTYCSIKKEWATEVRRHVEASRKGGPAIFKDSPPLLLKGMADALKRVVPTANLRIFRRSALSLLAQSNASVETLLTFSGHAREASLYSYLNWGLEMRQRAGAANLAAEAALW